MLELDDIKLVREYAQHNSEEAFACLVSKYINMVYSVALRQAGNPHQAEEITQAVFIILAKKSRSLREGTILSGWLYQTARLTAANYRRTEIRRTYREQEAHMQSSLNETDPNTWAQIAPLLDDAMADLCEKDRNAIVLRYFNEKNFRDVGAALGTSEDAAKMRVNRALEKLRMFFGKRGIALATAALSGAVSAHSVQAAPVGLVASVTATVLKGSAVTTSTLSFVKGTLKIMAWTKLKTAIVAGAGVLLAAGTATVAIKEVKQHRTYPWQVQNLSSTMLDQVPPQVRIVPAKFPQGGGWVKSGEKMLGIGQPADTILSAAYGGISPFRMVLQTKLPEGRYDFISNLPKGTEEAFQFALQEKFRLSAKREIREMEVLLLTVKRPNAEGLSLSQTEGGSSQSGPGRFSCVNQPISCLSSFLENSLEIPVVDNTGLTDAFDIDLTFNGPDGLKQVLLDELGLELMPGRKPIEMLVVEKGR